MGSKSYTLEEIPRLGSGIPRIFILSWMTDHIYWHKNSQEKNLGLCFCSGKRGAPSEYICDGARKVGPSRGLSFSIIFPGTKLHTISPQKHDEICVFYRPNTAPFWESYRSAIGVFEPTVRYERLLDELRETLLHLDTPGFADRADLLVLSLVNEVLISKAAMRNASSHAGVASVMSYLLTHFTEEPDIAKLCQEYGMSRRNFYREWQKQCPLSPIEFIQEHRLAYAARLLEEGRLSVSECALECGFRSISYFGVCFRKRFQVAPSVYHKQCASSASNRGTIKP
ncbi:MAG: AraC family transcriptional regulator [Victivallaceae bacterium]|nr:AraC family transcriptional regulator [Victivallaceae bacterium]